MGYQLVAGGEGSASRQPGSSAMLGFAVCHHGRVPAVNEHPFEILSPVPFTCMEESRRQETNVDQHDRAAEDDPLAGHGSVSDQRDRGDRGDRGDRDLSPYARIQGSAYVGGSICENRLWVYVSLHKRA